MATTHTYAGVHALARQALPGVRYQRYLLWRYSLIWTKPATGPTTMTVPVSRS